MQTIRPCRGRAPQRDCSPLASTIADLIDGDLRPRRRDLAHQERPRERRRAPSDPDAGRLMDKREQILQRLVEVAAGVPGVSTVVRNQDEISEHKRPAIAVFDADESADEAAERQDHPGRAPNLVVMTPEVLILLGAVTRERRLSAQRAARQARQGGAHGRAADRARRPQRPRSLRRLLDPSRPRPLDGRLHGRALRLRLRAAPRAALTSILMEARNARLSLDRQLLRRQRQAQLQGDRRDHVPRSRQRHASSRPRPTSPRWSISPRARASRRRTRRSSPRRR